MDKSQIIRELLNEDEIAFTNQNPDWTIAAKGRASAAMAAYSISLVFGGKDHKFFMIGGGYGLGYLDYKFKLQLCRSFSRDKAGDYDSNGKCKGAITISKHQNLGLKPIVVVRISLYERHWDDARLVLVGGDYYSVINSARNQKVSDQKFGVKFTYAYFDIVSYSWFF